MKVLPWFFQRLLVLLSNRPACNYAALSSVRRTCNIAVNVTVSGRTLGFTSMFLDQSPCWLVPHLYQTRSFCFRLTSWYVLKPTCTAKLYNPSGLSLFTLLWWLPEAVVAKEVKFILGTYFSECSVGFLNWVNVSWSLNKILELSFALLVNVF
jgi:hypothetical protein